jgi:hypothetical protein
LGLGYEQGRLELAKREEGERRSLAAGACDQVGEKEREASGPPASVGRNQVNERKREFFLFYFLKTY